MSLFFFFYYPPTTEIYARPLVGSVRCVEETALRLTRGFPPRLFAERTGLALEAIRPQLDEAAARGLLVETAEIVVPTDHGRRFLNDLLQLFLRE